MVSPGPRFNIKMTSYQYRKSHCGDKTILRPSYLHNGISYTGKTTSLRWIRAQATMRMLTTILHIFLSENLIWNIQQLKKLCKKKIVFAASTVLANEWPWTVKIIASGDCFNMKTIFPCIGIPTMIIAFRFGSSQGSRLWSKILFLSIQRPSFQV